MITEQILANLYKQIRDFCDINKQLASALGMSDTAFEVFYYVGFFGEGCTQKEICDYTNISKTSVNSAVKKLIEEDYIYIVHNDGRKDIYLTEKGRRMVRDNVDPLVTVELETVEDMKEEAEQMFNSLSKYIDTFKRKAGDYEG